MSIGIVIANWNGENVIRICLESLIAQTYTNFKIYITDNGSKDKSLDIIDEYKDKLNITVFKLENNTGFAHANNIAIEQAINDGNDYIFTLNNDTELEKDCILNAVNFIKNRKNKKEFYQLFIINYFNRDVCDCAGMLIDDKLIATQIGFNENNNNALNNNNSIGGVCAGAAFYSSILLKEVKLKYGHYFDEIYVSYFEDVDLSLRLKAMGNEPVLIKDSVVYHVHSATGNKISGFKQYYLTRNLLIYTKKNQSEENYNKNKFHYYNIIFHQIKHTIRNITITKNIIKGVIDSRKILKSINRR